MVFQCTKNQLKSQVYFLDHNLTKLKMRLKERKPERMSACVRRPFAGR